MADTTMHSRFGFDLLKVCGPSGVSRLVLAILFVGCCQVRAQTEVSRATDFASVQIVDVQSILPDIALDMRYASTNNFVGSRIDGYEAPKCFLHKRVAQALRSVELGLSEHGLRLKIFDCYRPVRAVRHFVRWAENIEDQRTKAQYYPNLDKAALLGEYIAPVSGHSRAATLDLTLMACDANGCQDLDMGTPFDFFDATAHTDFPGVSAEQRANRDRLRRAMKQAGFENYAAEWWHYTFDPEPSARVEYDIPIAARIDEGVEARDAQQLVLVSIADWNSTQGVLSTFERVDREWRRSTQNVPISIGAKGAAWGLGLHDQRPGPQKKEGDGRSPAGVFAVGTAFGKSRTVDSRLLYRAMTEFDYCMDVSDSPYYNRIVDVRDVGREVVSASTEPMRRDVHFSGDERYNLGFVIAHNPAGLVERGSCIFAHLWQSSGQTTAGCTAMSEDSMRKLIGWLREDRRPIFVLLPQSEYGRVQAEWDLPPFEP